MSESDPLRPFASLISAARRGALVKPVSGDFAYMEGLPPIADPSRIVCRWVDDTDIGDKQSCALLLFRLERVQAWQIRARDWKRAQAEADALKAELTAHEQTDPPRKDHMGALLSPRRYRAPAVPGAGE